MKAKLTIVLLALAGGIILFANQNVAKADEIDDLVTNLSNTNRLGGWNSGQYSVLRLPATASTNDVIKRIFDMGLPKEQEADYKILKIRQVCIPNGLRPDIQTYTAAIVQKDDSKKIILFNYWGPNLGWWSRVYDSKSEALGRIDLSMIGAKCKTEFVWPKHGNPEIVLERSEVNDVTTLTHSHLTHTNVPFVIQMEISDKQSGQTIVSNSVVALDMRYSPLPFPSDIILIDDYYSVFQAGHSYILFLQILQESEGLGYADVYLK
jgi:hypothetical protein